MNTSLVSFATTELSSLTITVAETTDLVGSLLIDSSCHSSLFQRKFPEFSPFRVLRSDSPVQTNVLPSKKTKTPTVLPPLEPDPPPDFNPLSSYSFNDCFGI
eukprot:TRINITY_DN10314_c0_g1_i3.p1 TRINITY_DN10314_c0_g1~~TRINITY_DN10314_c0_g1_i3.p1  ORF type:complete len:102 (-),score=6.18 TRINITY_DN10314_c0_g1_i3:197-502(-)